MPVAPEISSAPVAFGAAVMLSAQPAPSATSTISGEAGSVWFGVFRRLIATLMLVWIGTMARTPLQSARERTRTAARA